MKFYHHLLIRKKKFPPLTIVFKGKASLNFNCDSATAAMMIGMTSMMIVMACIV